MRPNAISRRIHEWQMYVGLYFMRWAVKPKVSPQEGCNYICK